MSLCTQTINVTLFIFNIKHVMINLNNMYLLIAIRIHLRKIECSQADRQMEGLEGGNTDGQVDRMGGGQEDE